MLGLDRDIDVAVRRRTSASSLPMAALAVRRPCSCGVLSVPRLTDSLSPSWACEGSYQTSVVSSGTGLARLERPAAEIVSHVRK